MREADNLPPYSAVVKKSRSLNFLDPSGPPMTCYGSALPFYWNSAARCNSVSIVSTTGFTTEESGCDTRLEQLTYSDASGCLAGPFPMVFQGGKP